MLNDIFSSGCSFISQFTMVLLPDPLGAEKINSFPLMSMDSLHHVQYLLFDLLEFVFHLYYDFLHLGLI